MCGQMPMSQGVHGTTGIGSPRAIVSCQMLVLGTLLGVYCPSVMTGSWLLSDLSFHPNPLKCFY